MLCSGCKVVETMHKPCLSPFELYQVAAGAGSEAAALIRLGIKWHPDGTETWTRCGFNLNLTLNTHI